MKKIRSSVVRRSLDCWTKRVYHKIVNIFFELNVRFCREKKSSLSFVIRINFLLEADVRKKSLKKTSHLILSTRYHNTKFQRTFSFRLIE